MLRYFLVILCLSFKLLAPYVSVPAGPCQPRCHLYSTLANADSYPILALVVQIAKWLPTSTFFIEIQDIKQKYYLYMPCQFPSFSNIRVGAFFCILRLKFLKGWVALRVKFFVPKCHLSSLCPLSLCLLSLCCERGAAAVAARGEPG